MIKASRQQVSSLDELKARAAAICEQHCPTWTVVFVDYKAPLLHRLLKINSDESRANNTILAQIKVDSRKIVFNQRLMRKWSYMPLWEDTALHEVAHALVNDKISSYEGHGYWWVTEALNLGVKDPSPHPSPQFKKYMT